jgi:protein-arginine kinase activator protein McsA
MWGGDFMIELPLKIEIYCYNCGSELKTKIIRTEVLNGIGMAIEVYPCESCAMNDAIERDLSD